MKFERTKFFDSFRLFLERHGKNLNQPRVDALNFLLGMFENIPAWNDVRYIAYALATISIETAWTFEPINEIGTNRYFTRYDGRADLGNTEPGDGARFKGRGYVQITGRRNYTRFENLLDIPLTTQPTLALEHEAAFLIMTYGMHQGLFTGKKLTDYINPGAADYRNARRIINGLDKADTLAFYAREIETVLKNALLRENEPQEILEIPAADPSLDSKEPTSIDNNTQTQSPEQNAGVIANVNTSDTAPVTEAAGNLPPTEIEAPAPTGFGTKLIGFILAVISGQQVIPQWIQDGVGANREFLTRTVLALFHGIYEQRYLILTGLVVWYVTKKINRAWLTSLLAKVNADPTKGSVVLVDRGKKPVWERLMFWK